MTWYILQGDSPEVLGLLPAIFQSRDKRPAREQANDRYAHGGGWRPQDGWQLNVATDVARYPGDPEMRPIAVCALNGERILLYPHGYVAIQQRDGAFEMARMD